MRPAEITVRRIVSVSRVNRLLGSYTIVNRPYALLSYKVSGCSEFIQGRNRFVSDKNHILFVPAGASYSYACQEDGDCVLLEFETDAVPREAPLIASYEVSNDKEIDALFNKIERHYTFRRAGYTAYCMSGLYRLFYYMELQQAGRPYLQSRCREQLQRGMDYLEAHLCDPALQVHALAEAAGISEIYFRKLFVQFYGLPPKQYINFTRLAKARAMLRIPGISVREIAEEVGFRDVYNFSKAFRRTNGCSPTAYRKSLGSERTQSDASVSAAQQKSK